MSSKYLLLLWFCCHCSIAKWNLVFHKMFISAPLLSCWVVHVVKHLFITSGIKLLWCTLDVLISSTNLHSELKVIVYLCKSCTLWVWICRRCCIEKQLKCKLCLCILSFTWWALINRKCGQTMVRRQTIGETFYWLLCWILLNWAESKLILNQKQTESWAKFWAICQLNFGPQHAVPQF